MADAADEIGDAITDTVDGCERLMCAPHIKRKLRTVGLEKLYDKNAHDDLLKDFDYLQTLGDSQVYEHSYRKFLHHWEHERKEHRFTACCVWHVACCVLHIVCCMLRVARCVLRVARCVLHVAVGTCTTRSGRMHCMLHLSCCMSHVARYMLHVITTCRRWLGATGSGRRDR